MIFLHYTGFLLFKQLFLCNIEMTFSTPFCSSFRALANCMGLLTFVPLYPVQGQDRQVIVADALVIYLEHTCTFAERVLYTRGDQAPQGDNQPVLLLILRSQKIHVEL
ncbi:MAG: hypothetical protein D3905_17205 [Candidatus Electrothrix sp. AS4_5]|nr:hypothetical protein [Candidatus Electrothrix gigas]